jgi:hypothetical protein
MGMSYDQSINETLAQSGDATVTLTGGFHASANAAIKVDIGFTGFKVAFDASMAESFDASLSADYAADWSKSIPLGPEVTFGTYTFAILDVPVVVTPFVRFEGEVAGHVEGNASASIHQSFGATAGVTIANDGVTTRHSLNMPAPTFSGPSATAKADAKVSAVPTIALRFYGAAEAGLQLRPYLKLSTDVCTLTLSAGIDLGFKVDIEIAHHEVADYAPSPINLADTVLNTMDLPTCEHWTGQIYWHGNAQYESFDPAPADPFIHVRENAFVVMANRDSTASFSSESDVPNSCDSGGTWSTDTNSMEATNAPGTLDLEIKFGNPGWWVPGGIEQGFDYTGSTVGCPASPNSGNGLPASSPMCPFKEFMERAIPSDTHPEGSYVLAGSYTAATPENPPECSPGYAGFDGGMFYKWQLTRAPDADHDGLPDSTDSNPNTFDPMPTP